MFIIHLNEHIVSNQQMLMVWYMVQLKILSNDERFAVQESETQLFSLARIAARATKQLMYLFIALFIFAGS